MKDISKRMPETLRKTVVFLFLFVLCSSAFFIRVHNFKVSNLRSIDEIVYYRMGQQLARNPLNYNTIPYAHELIATGRKLPPYFTEPLFKHPPVFAYSIAASLKVFGTTLLSAEYVPLFSSILMIVLIYILGAALFNWQTGLLAALFLWMDPINIICSQKVWMEATIGFFSLATIVFFVLGLKSNDNFFFLSGIAAGLGINTKYTAALMPLAILLYALLYERPLFANYKFRLGMALPFLSLLPWGLWNWAVYGVELKGHFQGADDISWLRFKAGQLLPGVVLLAAGILVVLKFIKKSESQTAKTSGDPTANPFMQRLSFLLLLSFCFVVLKENFLRAFVFDAVPSHSWGMGLFQGEPAFFYFGRLIEFSLIYLFGYVGLFCFHPVEDKTVSILRLSAFFVLVFHIVWGNFQSRYILPATPFLLLLGAQQIVRCYHSIREIDHPAARVALQTFFTIILTYISAKVMFMNLTFSFPHNFCYF